MNYETQIAKDLLSIKAVSLSPNDPFTWASGLKSPIYTDNRLTISTPSVRDDIASGLVELIQAKFPEVEAIGGVATAGIPHATLVADRMNLPLIYVRPKPKDHGKGRQIEGDVKAGTKVVLIDDLLSTGGSVLKAAAAASNEGVDVIGVAAIFSYELAAVKTNFEEAGIDFATLTNYSHLIEIASQENYVSSEDLKRLKKWREDPENWL